MKLDKLDSGDSYTLTYNLFDALELKSKIYFDS